MHAKRTAQRILVSGFTRMVSFFAKSVAFLAILSFLFISSSSGADYYWSVTSGDWSDATCWGGTAPTSSDTAYINNGGTASVSSTGGTCNYLYLGNATGESGQIEQNNGFLKASYEYIGYSGVGSFIQFGGTNTVGPLYLGYYNSTATGTYALSGTGCLSASTEYIGYSGNGTFMQTGGSHAVTTALYLGRNSASSGLYSLSGDSSLTSASEYIGYSGCGLLSQSGGTHAITGNLSLGYSSTATGTYALSGTGCLSASREYIGKSGNGTFMQSGGTNSISSSLDLGYNSGSTGIYTLSSDSLLLIAAGGTLNIGAGSGTGVFQWFGGTLSSPSVNLGSKGTFAIGFNGYLDSILSGMTFGSSSGMFLITNGAALSQTDASTMALTNLAFGASTGAGSYSLDGIKTLKTTYEYVGYSGSGTFNQSGGTHAISGDLYLGYNSTATGAYALSGTGVLVCIKRVHRLQRHRRFQSVGRNEFSLLYIHRREFQLSPFGRHGQHCRRITKSRHARLCQQFCCSSDRRTVDHQSFRWNSFKHIVCILKPLRRVVANRLLGI